jgi:hypothetical protein
MRKASKRSFLGYNADSVNQMLGQIQTLHDQTKTDLKQNKIDYDKVTLISASQLTYQLKVSLFGLNKKAVFRNLTAIKSMQEAEIIDLILQNKKNELETIELKEAELEEVEHEQAELEEEELEEEELEEVELEEVELEAVEPKEVTANTVRKIAQNSIYNSSKAAATSSLMAAGHGFWGEMDQYLELEYRPTQNPNVFESIPQLNIPNLTVISTAQKQVAATQVKPDFKKEIKPESEEQQEDSTHQMRKSPALTEEILSIRQRYIVGKKTGEDLLDRNGQLIIAKNSTITAQVIEKADAEGKLSDLIVHMIITGLGE